jgi:hypothetical protein
MWLLLSFEGVHILLTAAVAVAVRCCLMPHHAQLLLSDLPVRWLLLFVVAYTLPAVRVC